MLDFFFKLGMDLRWCYYCFVWLYFLDRVYLVGVVVLSLGFVEVGEEFVVVDDLFVFEV